MTGNGLRAGDVALCCAPKSGQALRQGYGACTLLWGGVFIY